MRSPARAFLTRRIFLWLMAWFVTGLDRPGQRSVVFFVFPPVWFFNNPRKMCSFLIRTNERNNDILLMRAADRLWGSYQVRSLSAAFLARKDVQRIEKMKTKMSIPAAIAAVALIVTTLGTTLGSASAQSGTWTRFALPEGMANQVSSVKVVGTVGLQGSADSDQEILLVAEDVAQLEARWADRTKFVLVDCVNFPETDVTLFVDANFEGEGWRYACPPVATPAPPTPNPVQPRAYLPLLKR